MGNPGFREGGGAALAILSFPITLSLCLICSGSRCKKIKKKERKIVKISFSPRATGRVSCQKNRQAGL